MHYGITYGERQRRNTSSTVHKEANPAPPGLLFFLLAAGDFTGMHAITTVAGVVGIFCGGSALYVAFAQVLNEVYGKTMMPL